MSQNSFQLAPRLRNLFSQQPEPGSQLLLPVVPSSALVPPRADVKDSIVLPDVIQVEIKEAGSTAASNLEEAAFSNPLAQESCCKFLSSQEAEDMASSSPKKDSNPMVICQLEGGTQMLCIDNSSTRELKALHLVPQYQDQNNCLQSDVSKPLTTLVGRFLPVPTKLNLLTQQACLDRNPEAFQPKIGKGRLGDLKPHHYKGCNCKLSGCLKNYCECYEAKIMCSSVCKCIDCKNYEESPERKTLMNMPKPMETTEPEGSHHLSPVKISELSKFRENRRPSCISREVVEAACACLLAQGEEAEKDHCSPCLAERMILEEFGWCLLQILYH